MLKKYTVLKGLEKKSKEIQMDTVFQGMEMWRSSRQEVSEEVDVALAVSSLYHTVFVY